MEVDESKVILVEIFQCRKWQIFSLKNSIPVQICKAMIAKDMEMGEMSSSVEMIANQRPRAQFRQLTLTLLEGQLRYEDVIKETRRKYVK